MLHPAIINILVSISFNLSNNDDELVLSLLLLVGFVLLLLLVIDEDMVEALLDSSVGLWINVVIVF